MRNLFSLFIGLNLMTSLAMATAVDVKISHNLDAKVIFSQINSTAMPTLAPDIPGKIFALEWIDPTSGAIYQVENLAYALAFYLDEISISWQKGQLSGEQAQLYSDQELIHLLQDATTLDQVAFIAEKHFLALNKISDTSTGLFTEPHNALLPHQMKFAINKLSGQLSLLDFGNAPKGIYELRVYSANNAGQFSLTEYAVQIR